MRKEINPKGFKEFGDYLIGIEHLIQAKQSARALSGRSSQPSTNPPIKMLPSKFCKKAKSRKSQT